MRNRRLVVVGAAAAVVVVAVIAVAAALGAFRSDADRARDAVSELMESYVVPEADEDGDDPDDAAWPAEDYGDAATMETLETYGVDPDEWRRHCLGNLSYEVGEAAVEGDSAQVSLTVTNTSLSAAVEAAGTEFESFSATEEAEEAYAEGGRSAMFENLVQRVYDHLDANESPVTTTVEVTCAKGEDGDWVAQVSGDEAFFSALYGGSDVIAGLGSEG